MSVANRSGRLIRTARSQPTGSAANAPQSLSTTSSSSSLPSAAPVAVAVAVPIPAAPPALAPAPSSSSSLSAVRPVSVFIRNLPPSVTNKILMMDLFSSSDLSNLQIIRLIVHTDAIGRCAGTAEVIVANDEQARAVVEKYNEQMKFGRTLKLSILEQEAVGDAFITHTSSHSVVTEPASMKFSSPAASFPAFGTSSSSSSSSSISSANPTFAALSSSASSWPAAALSTPRGPVASLGMAAFSSPPDVSTLGFHQLSNYSQLAVDTEFRVTDMAATRRKAAAAAAAAAAEREREEKEREKRKRKEEEDSAAKQKRGKLVVTKGKGNQKAAVFRTGSSSAKGSGLGLSISTTGGKVVHLSRKRSLPSNSSASLSDTQERKKPKLGVVKKRKSAPVNPP